MTQFIPTVLALTTATLLTGFTHAQNATFPNKPVAFVVPFPLGGGTDIGARVPPTLNTHFA